MLDFQIVSNQIQRLPKHIAIIMDGNGRWAQKRNLPRSAGHRAGVKTVREIVQACNHKGIEVLTLFAFGCENWRRPLSEVNYLMKLFLAALDKEVKLLNKNNVQLKVIGNLEHFSHALCARIQWAQQLTANNTGLKLVIAADYSGRWDITLAMQRLGHEIAAQKLQPQAITQELIQSYLSTSGWPEPDLFIRTSGEQRISNFLLWQLAYTELYFAEAYWPDFNTSHLEAALAFYANRQRRFGYTPEQVIGKQSA